MSFRVRVLKKQLVFLTLEEHTFIMTTRKLILRRVRKSPPGSIFSPTDFADLGTPYAIGMALARRARCE